MRIKEFILNIGSSYAHIVISVLLNIMYIPIALHYMGIERYGVWVVLLTIINYLTLANFGVPTAVTNLMSQSVTDTERASLLIKGFKILSVICLGVLMLCIAGYLLISHCTKWLSPLSTEIRLSSIILMLFFIVRIPFQIATAAFTACRKIFIGKIYDLLTIVITFLSLLIAIHFEQNLVFLAVLSGILLLILNIVSFYNALKIVDIVNYVTPHDSISSKSIYKPGIALFAAGMGSLIIWNTDNIIISKFLGFQEVAIYSTAFRMFSFGYMSFNLIYGVLIPYYGQFYRQKAWPKLESLFKFNLIIIPLIAISVWLVGWLFAKDLIYLWLGDYKLYAGSSLYFLLGAYGLTLACVGVMFNLLTSLNLLKALFYITVAEAIINLVASVFLAKLLGSEGVALGTLIASLFVPFSTLPFLIDNNEQLQFRFPFKKFILGIIFYVLILLILFMSNADQYGFFTKLLICIPSLSLFAFFQYYYNRELIMSVISTLRPKKNV